MSARYLASAPMRPYDETTIPPYEEMMGYPVFRLDARDLEPTQEQLQIARLIAIADGHAAEGPDTAIHLVELEDRLYVHNGHHRWTVARLRGDTIRARITRAG